MGKNRLLLKNPSSANCLSSLLPDEELIINILKEKGVTGIDVICSESRLGPSKVASVLLNLEFEQIVKCLPGKIYNLV